MLELQVVKVLQISAFCVAMGHSPGEAGLGKGWWLVLRGSQFSYRPGTWAERVEREMLAKSEALAPS